MTEIIGSLKEGWRNELEEENKWSLEKMKQELKEAIKIELCQRGSQYSPPIEADIQLLDARVSTKGSNAKITVKPSGKEHVVHVMPTMGLYMQGDHSTNLVALGKIYEGGLPYIMWLMQMMC